MALAGQRRCATIFPHQRMTAEIRKLYETADVLCRGVVGAWVNGHTHVNTITAHRREGGGGFWEITTASCIDFPQQQQVVELLDTAAAERDA